MIVSSHRYTIVDVVHIGRMKEPREAYVLFALSALEEWRIDDFSVKQQCPTMCATES